MNRLIHWTLTLFLLTTALTGGVVAYARTHSGENPLKAYGFDVCDGKPCFMGTMPGMDWNMARATLVKRSEITFDSGTEIDIKSRGVNVTVARSNQAEQTVGYMQGSALSPDVVFPSLGYFIAMYGQPCQVASLDEDIYIRYPGFSLVTGGLSLIDHLDRLTPFSMVFVFRLDNNDVCDRKSFSMVWKGFTRLTWAITQ